MSEPNHFTTDEYGRPAIVCPECGDGWLHQSRVEVFVRDSEDEDRGIHATIDYQDGVSIDRSMAENPSPRRDGIAIAFECELCGGDARTLHITQHKGNEFMSWRWSA